MTEPQHPPPPAAAQRTGGCTQRGVTFQSMPSSTSVPLDPQADTDTITLPQHNPTSCVSNTDTAVLKVLQGTKILFLSSVQPKCY